MGVQEELHGRSPRNAEATSSGSSSKSGAIRICPRALPGFLRAGRVGTGGRRTIGLPEREMTTSSPAMARSISLESWVLASYTFTGSVAPMYE